MNNPTRPSFIKKANPPPEVIQGQRKTAVIEAIQLEDGKYGEQWRFDLDIDGYKTRAWIKHYDEPSEASALGLLCINLCSTLDVFHDRPQDYIKDLKAYGLIFVECKGFRTHEGKTFPKFSIVPELLPAKKEQVRF